MSAKDFYIQNITVSEHDSHSNSFQVKFQNVLTNYTNGPTRVEEKKYIYWDHYEFILWQTQLNFIVFCASSARGVSVKHMNAKKPMIRSTYRFHVYYHIRKLLERLGIPLPYENSFNQYSIPYNHERFIEICGEYEVSNDLKEWRHQTYFSMWQTDGFGRGIGGMIYMDESSFSRWIIRNSYGLTKTGLKKLPETVRNFAYLILTSQTSMRGPIVGHEARNLDAQQVCLSTFENIINRRIDIPEDIQRVQRTLQYARSKVDYTIGESIYMLPSDINLRIGKVKDYNNKILVASSSFKIGTNLKINLDDDKPDVRSKKDDKHIERDKPDVKSKKEEIIKTKPNIKSKKDIKMIKFRPDMYKITYEEEKAALILGITAVFTVWWMFK